MTNGPAPGDVHVVPNDDLIDHADHGCICGPDYWCEIGWRNHGDHTHLTVSAWLVTHHSLDGRELREQ